MGFSKICERCVCVFAFPQRSIKSQRLGRSSPFGRSSSLLVMKRKLVCAAAQDDDDDADSDNEMVAWHRLDFGCCQKKGSIDI